MELSILEDNRSLVTNLDLAKIDEAANEYAANSKAQSTVRSYQSDWKHFVTWCQAVGLQHLPATNDTVKRYITFCAKGYTDEEGHLVKLKVSTLQRRISAINAAHRLAHHKPISLRDEPLHSTWAGLKNAEGIAQEGKKPLRFEDLAKALSKLPTTLIGIRDRALLLIGFAGAFRRSEVVSLNYEDLEFRPEGLVIHIRKSKTDQEAKGQEVAITYLPNPDICPIRALQFWLEKAHIESGAVFRGVDKAGRVLTSRQTKSGKWYSERLSDKSVALIVKKAVRLLITTGAVSEGVTEQEYADKCGLNPSSFGGHSLRAGFATSAAENGVPERVIQKQTRHKSLPTLRKYIRDGDLFRENATSFMAHI